MTKYLVVVGRKGSVWLNPKENLTDTTINNAKTKGIRLAGQKDVPDPILKKQYGSVRAAKRTAEKHGFGAVCYQSLRQRA